jgi:acyl-CoA thioester hydrolase
MEKYITGIHINIDWAELDLFGHVNNVAFFRYIQAARVHYCEIIGLTSLNEKNKPGFLVASSHCNFRKSLKFPGTVRIYVKTKQVNNTSFVLNYLLYDDAGQLAADAEDVLVVFDYNTRQKIQITAELRKMIQKTDENAI